MICAKSKEDDGKTANLVPAKVETSKPQILQPKNSLGKHDTPESVDGLCQIEADRRSPSPFAIDYSVKRSSGRFVPFQSAPDTKANIQVDAVKGPRITADGTPCKTIRMPHQYRPIKPSTQKPSNRIHKGIRKADVTAPSGRPKRKYKRKAQFEAPKSQRTAPLLNQVSLLQNGFSNDIIMNGQFSNDPSMQRQIEILQLQANQMLSINSTNQSHPTIPHVYSQSALANFLFSHQVTSADFLPPSMSAQQFAVAPTLSVSQPSDPRSYGQSPCNSNDGQTFNGLKLQPIIEQHNKAVPNPAILQCGNSPAPIHLLPIGSFQLVNYPTASELIVNTSRPNQMPYQVNDLSGVINSPMQLSRLGTIPIFETNQSNQTILNKSSLKSTTCCTNTVQSPFQYSNGNHVMNIDFPSQSKTNGPSMQEESHIRMTDDNTQNTFMGNRSTPGCSGDQSNLTMIDGKSRCAQLSETANEGSTRPTVPRRNRGSVSVQSVSAEPTGQCSRRQSGCRQSTPSLACMKDDIITHIVEGFVIKESLRPFQMQSNDNVIEQSNRQNVKLIDHKNSSPNSECDILTSGTKNEIKQSLDDSDTTNKDNGRRKQKTKRTRSSKAGLEKNKKSDSKGNKRSRKSSMLQDSLDHSFEVEASNPIATDEKTLTSDSGYVAHKDNQMPTDRDEKISAYESTDPSQWTVDDVYAFVVDRTGSAEIAGTFRSQEIDGSALLLVKEEFLMQFMNMKLGPALKLCSRIAELKAAYATISPLNPR